MATRSGKNLKTDRVEPRLLALKDAAQYLGISTWGLRERIWNGEIPVVQWPGGRKQFLDVQDLNRFIEENKRVIR